MRGLWTVSGVWMVRRGAVHTCAVGRLNGLATQRLHQGVRQVGRLESWRVGTPARRAAARLLRKLRLVGTVGDRSEQQLERIRRRAGLGLACCVVDARGVGRDGMLR